VNNFLFTHHNGPKGLYIDGEYTECDAGKTIEMVDSATETV